MFSHRKENGENYLEEAQLPPERLEGKHILNVGAGKTDLEGFLRKRYGVVCWVVNVDLGYNPYRKSLLWKLAGKMPRNDFPNRSVWADTRALPIQDNTFDITFARNIIPFFLTYKGETQALSEIARVTRGPIYVYPSPDSTLLAARRLGLDFPPTRNSHGTLVMRD